MTIKTEIKCRCGKSIKASVFETDILTKVATELGFHIYCDDHELGVENCNYTMDELIKYMESVYRWLRANKIKELQKEKSELLDQFGIFGGGTGVNLMHSKINQKLEALGVDPNT